MGAFRIRSARPLGYVLSDARPTGIDRLYGKGPPGAHPLVTGTFVQGLVATEGEEKRVYAVTIHPTLPDQAAIHERWPKIIFASEVVTAVSGQDIRTFRHT